MRIELQELYFATSPKGGLYLRGRGALLFQTLKSLICGEMISVWRNFARRFSLIGTFYVRYMHYKSLQKYIRINARKLRQRRMVVTRSLQVRTR